MRMTGTIKILAATLALVVGAMGAQSAVAQKKPRSGTVTISQVNVALLWSASLGGGSLSYQGKTHEFVVGGLGVGGIGASSLEATGEVYGLSRLEDFQGVYVQARYGYAVGDQSAGKLWLENAKGVGLGLKADRVGLALTAGADGVVIKFK